MKSTIQSRCHQLIIFGAHVLYIVTGNRRNASLFDNTCFARAYSAPCRARDKLPVCRGFTLWSIVVPTVAPPCPPVVSPARTV